MDAAYINLTGRDLVDGEAITQIQVEDPRLHGTIVIDLDGDERVLGIELVGFEEMKAGIVPR
ncbi:DUF2283 domain-containing protein [Isoptericola halotolerans]|uniref:DUF2283 domain-containing protein n=1 Tax=Isoptericola halotolerans TaxID=300560 RepID=UPI001494C166